MQVKYKNIAEYLFRIQSINGQSLTEVCEKVSNKTSFFFSLNGGQECIHSFEPLFMGTKHANRPFSAPRIHYTLIGASEAEYK